MKKKRLAIIPARGGSKGIPFKNIKSVNGKPLMSYTIKAAQQSRLFDRIVVSTEDAAIARVAKSLGADVVERPRKLATDTAATEPVMQHVLDCLRHKSGYVPHDICLLQPTSPLRTAAHIRAAYRTFARGKRDSLLSVTGNTLFIWKQKGASFVPLNYDYRKRPRRQDMKTQFRENGAIYIIKHDVFQRNKNRLGGTISLYRMGEEESIEVDTNVDLIVVEHILKRRKDGR